MLLLLHGMIKPGSRQRTIACQASAKIHETKHTGAQTDDMDAVRRDQAQQAEIARLQTALALAHTQLAEAASSPVSASADIELRARVDELVSRLHEAHANWTAAESRETELQTHFTDLMGRYRQAKAAREEAACEADIAAAANAELAEQNAALQHAHRELTAEVFLLLLGCSRTVLMHCSAMRFVPCWLRRWIATGRQSKKTSAPRTRS
jgi:hypothetical protein